MEEASPKRKRNVPDADANKKVLVLARKKSCRGSRGTSYTIWTEFVSPSDLPERYRKESEGAFVQVDMEIDFTKVDHHTASGRYAEYQAIKKLDKDDRALWRVIADAADESGECSCRGDYGFDQMIGAIVANVVVYP